MSDPPIIVHSPPALRLGTLNVGLGFQRKLPHLLARCAALALDVVALQEIGDPALLSNRLTPYTLAYVAGPSHHEAGVGLLVSQALVPFIRSYRRSRSGRLIAAVLELSRGQQLLLVSAYMPTGLDHSAAASPARQQAHQLYDELLQWSVGMQQVVLLGDLNETLSRWDRLPVPAVHAAGDPAASPIRCLQRDGFTDVYRQLHPDSQSSPGYTHAIAGARPVQSRLDYLWTRGLQADAVLRVRIDRKLQALSHHHLLWAEIRVARSAAAQPPNPVQSMQLPNLRAATKEALQQFADLVEEQLQQSHDELDLLAASDSAASLSQVATSLSALARHAAAQTLPVTGAAPYSSRCVLQLQRQREALSRLLRISTSILHPIAAPASAVLLTRCPEWRRLHRRCVQDHALRWTVCAWYSGDAAAWLAETRDMLQRTRCAIKHEQRRMKQQPRSQADENPAAWVHRMLDSDALPSQILSVVNADGDLTTSAGELKQVMAEHFRGVFAIPAEPPPDPQQPPVPAMLLDKPTVDAAWYGTLMDDVGEAELLAVASDTPLVSAPGEDEVSSGLWKAALTGSEHLRGLVCSLFSSCLRTSCFPSAWKSSIIVPLLKDALKERAMSNVRPISLQNCLGKLLMKILARRLGSVFAGHPILNPAQRGFVNGGSIGKCIDELLDAWDWSRVYGRELYTLLYDIRQAYDSVQVDVLRRAMQRLRMPAAFIELVVDSLTGLTSRVRTAYGLSEFFDVLRSLRQGDPLAPLLFVILMDALHDGLERNPFTGQQHGLTIELRNAVSIGLPSLGYADDTSVLTGSLPDLRVQNDWVHYFMAFNRLRLNHSKCELVGRTAAGEPVSAAALAAAGVTIEGLALQPVPHDQPIRYLGVHVCFDGSWRAMQQKAREKIFAFTRAVSKFRVSLGHAVYMFNVFLLPMLELALHYVHGAGTSRWIQECDRLLIGSIKHAAASPIMLSHTAVALTLGLRLPSWVETSVKVSELFLRLNSTDARWSELGRALMRERLPSSIDAATAIPRADSGSRQARAAHLAVTRLGWSLHLAVARRANSRHPHLFDSQPAGLLPGAAECSSAPLCQLVDGPTLLAQDLWRGWGAAAQPRRVHVYSDGSHDPTARAPAASSSWAVTIGDEWLAGSYGGVPADEALLQSCHAAGATLLGASITCTDGVYPAELQAIARLLAMLPLSFAVHIHSDSQASIAAVAEFQQQCNERKRLRMAARPLLQLIDHLLHRRKAAGGSARLSHVRAHSRATDMHSVGNRLTDWQANQARLKPAQPRPLNLQQLPLAECEQHLHVVDEAGSGRQVIDDIRRTSFVQLKQSAMLKWQSKPEQGYLAGLGTVALGSVALRQGTAEQQVTLLHVATNSIHYHWRQLADGTAALQQLQCAACAAALTLTHATACPAPASANYRSLLQSCLLTVIGGSVLTADWLRRHGGSSLAVQLRSLFPAPVGASAEQLQRHHTAVMCGAFTAAQASAAARTLGFTSEAVADDGRQLMKQLRLACLDAVQPLFAGEKLAQA